MITRRIPNRPLSMCSPSSIYVSACLWHLRWLLLLLPPETPSDHLYTKTLRWSHRSLLIFVCQVPVKQCLEHFCWLKWTYTIFPSSDCLNSLHLLCSHVLHSSKTEMHIVLKLTMLFLSVLLLKLCFNLEFSLHFIYLFTFLLNFNSFFKDLAQITWIS